MHDVYCAALSQRILAGSCLHYLRIVDREQPDARLGIQLVPWTVVCTGPALLVIHSAFSTDLTRLTTVLISLVGAALVTGLGDHTKHRHSTIDLLRLVPLHTYVVRRFGVRSC